MSCVLRRSLGFYICWFSFFLIALGNCGKNLSRDVQRSSLPLGGPPWQQCGGWFGGKAGSSSQFGTLVLRPGEDRWALKVEPAENRQRRHLGSRVDGTEDLKDFYGDGRLRGRKGRGGRFQEKVRSTSFLTSRLFGR